MLSASERALLHVRWFLRRRDSTGIRITEREKTIRVYVLDTLLLSSPRSAQTVKASLVSYLRSMEDKIGAKIEVFVEVDPRAFQLSRRIEASLAELAIGQATVALVPAPGGVEVTIFDLPRKVSIPKVRECVLGILRDGPPVTVLEVVSSRPRIANADLLVTLKIHQPCSRERLRELVFKRAGGAAPKQFDVAWRELRNAGQVIEEPNGALALSPLGLNALPGRPGKYSSDVLRALTLARRRW